MLGAVKVFGGTVEATAFDFPDRRLSKQVEVSDFEKTKRILIELGLAEKPHYPLVKHRVSYTFDMVRFEIDTFSQFPTFLEIEGPSRQVIDQYILKLGLNPHDARPWGVREVFAHYRQQGKIS